MFGNRRVPPHIVFLLSLLLAAVCLFIGPAFAAGLPPWTVALGALGILALVTGWRRPSILRGLPVPWLMAATGANLADGIAMGILPFLIGDAIKGVAAMALLPGTWRMIGSR